MFPSVTYRLVYCRCDRPSTESACLWLCCQTDCAYIRPCSKPVSIPCPNKVAHKPPYASQTNLMLVHDPQCCAPKITHFRVQQNWFWVTNLCAEPRQVCEQKLILWWWGKQEVFFLNRFHLLLFFISYIVSAKCWQIHLGVPKHQ